MGVVTMRRHLRLPPRPPPSPTTTPRSSPATRQASREQYLNQRMVTNYRTIPTGAANSIRLRFTSLMEGPTELRKGKNKFIHMFNPCNRVNFVRWNEQAIHLTLKLLTLFVHQGHKIYTV